MWEARYHPSPRVSAVVSPASPPLIAGPVLNSGWPSTLSNIHLPPKETFLSQSFAMKGLDPASNSKPNLILTELDPMERTTRSMSFSSAPLSSSAPVYEEQDPLVESFLYHQMSELRDNTPRVIE